MSESTKEKLKRLLYVSLIALACYIIYLYLRRQKPNFITAALVPTAGSGVTGTTPTATTLNFPAPLPNYSPGDVANQNPSKYYIGGNSYGPLDFGGAGPVDYSITGPATYYITPGPSTGKQPCGCGCDNTCGSCAQQTKTPTQTTSSPMMSSAAPTTVASDWNAGGWLTELQQEQSQYDSITAGPTFAF